METNIIHRIRRKLLKLRLQPIRIFCFHQVSAEFDASTMWECDWMQIDEFKKQIEELRKDYTFISLPEAYQKLNRDGFRRRKYAVLTADDGWSSLTNIIPWLVEQHIPLTLFVNPYYLDGIHKQERETEKLLTKEELSAIVDRYYPLITIASHSWKHVHSYQLTKSQFTDYVELAKNDLETMRNYIPFFAFPFGTRSYENLEVLQEKQLIPVLMDGNRNVRYDGNIHREELK